jgi:plastocyanin
MKISKPMASYFLLAVLAGLVLLVSERAMTGSQGKATGVTVTIDNFSFSPDTIAVKSGTQVTWVNHDDIPHTVVSTENAFKSKALDSDDKFVFTPDKPGTYTYFCSLHPKMTGKVVVQ